MLQAFKDLENIDANVLENGEIILRIFPKSDTEHRDNTVELIGTLTKKKPLMLIEFPQHDKIGVAWEKTEKGKNAR